MKRKIKRPGKEINTEVAQESVRLRIAPTLSEAEVFLIEECAKDLALFASVFLANHVSRAFSKRFHLELFRDLRALSMPTPSTNIDIYHPKNHPILNSSNAPSIVPRETLSALNDISALPVLPKLPLMPLPPRERSDIPPGTESIRCNNKEQLQKEVNNEKDREIKLPGRIGVGGEADNYGEKRTCLPQNSADPPGTFKSLKAKEIDWRLAIAAPRGHAKSTIVSLVYVLWCLCYRLHKYVLLVSDSEEQAKMLLGTVRAELEMNERLRRCYGDLVGAGEKWGELVIETTTGIRVQTRSTMSRIRGLKFGSERPGLIILDDSENDQSVESEEQRAKLKRWFYGALLPARKIGGKVVVIGTLLHEDSLLAELLETWPSRKYAAMDEEGPLWPEAFSLKDLEQMKSEYEARGQVDVFYREYMSEVISKDSALFTRSNFKYVEKQELLGRMGQGEEFKTFLGWDPAYTVKSSSDYTAFVVAMVDVKKSIYIIEAIRRRLDLTHMIRELFRLVEKYAPREVAVQKIDWDRALERPVREEMARRDNRFKVTLTQAYSSTLQGLSSKVTRIAQLAPLYSVGQVVHVRNAPGIKDLEGELLAFPRSKRDDLSDATALLREVLYPPQPKKERHVKMFDDRAGSISGY